MVNVGFLMFWNNLYVCPFIVTKIIVKTQFENLTVSQMTVRETSVKIIWEKGKSLNCEFCIFFRDFECTYI